MAQETIHETRGLGLINALATRTEIKETWFNHKTVQLDGFNFLGCRFDNCRLQIASPEFELHRCYVDNSNIFHYQGDVVKVLRIFNTFHPWVDEHYPYFVPERHDDGTISIHNRS